MDKIVFTSVGRCIFCGEASRKLHTEHIIPHGLGGRWELPHSSCVACQAITGGIEKICLREMFGAGLFRGGLPARKRKRKPTRVTVSRDDGQSFQVGLEDFPIIFAWPNPNEPTLLHGLDPTAVWQPSYLVTRNESQVIASAKKHGDYWVQRKFNLETFSRMLAKIAHSYCVAKKHLEHFTPLLPEFIRNGSKTPTHWVGADSNPSPPQETGLHQLDVHLVRREGREFIVVGIRLFCGIPAPRYLVVAGQAG